MIEKFSPFCFQKMAENLENYVFHLFRENNLGNIIMTGETLVERRDGNFSKNAQIYKIYGWLAGWTDCRKKVAKLAINRL